jgi:putative ABC transport system substrate-binding protein
MGTAMKHRQFIGLVGGTAVLPFAARAQQRSVPRRIAIFHPAIPASLITGPGGSAWRACFGQLRRRGYVEGENLVIARCRIAPYDTAPLGQT